MLSLRRFQQALGRGLIAGRGPPIKPQLYTRMRLLDGYDLFVPPVESRVRWLSTVVRTRLFHDEVNRLFRELPNPTAIMFLWRLV